MFVKPLLFVLASVALLGAAPAKAEVIFFSNLTVGQEVGATTPANPALLPFRQGPGGVPDEDAARPESFGTASLVLNAARTALTMSITVFNIDVTGTQTPGTFDNLTAAHIHAPNPPGAAAPVVWGFVGTPFHDLNQQPGDVVPFAVGVGGTFNVTWDLDEGVAGGLTGQIDNLIAGLAYLNFHTVQFPGGEIRGQILVVPEPAALALLALALGGVYLTSRRRIR